jgi:hypothetical protein
MKHKLVKLQIKKNKKAEKNFVRQTGVPYEIRVRNLNSGETEW